MKRLTKLLGLTLLMAGCAYYNGIYNANQLRDSARKAEREGRPGEARSLWARVIIKTDTVLARYPESNRRFDALLLKGTAYLQLNSCDRATPALNIVVDSASDQRLVDEAALYLGECLLRLDRTDSAMTALNLAAASEDARIRSRALRWRGQALFESGRLDAALEDLEGSTEPSAQIEKARVLSALGDEEAATDVLLGAADRGRYVEEEWLSAIEGLGRLSLDAASQVADTLRNRRTLTRGQEARLLMADAARLASAGATRRSMDRYGQAVSVAADSIEARQAAILRELVAIRAATELDSIDVFRSRLEDAATPTALATVPTAAVTLRTLRTIVRDTAPSVHPDLVRFLRAEALRDSARAPGLAAAMFESVAARYPESAIAAKALIAAAMTSPSHGEDLLQRAYARYPDSPYTEAFRGLDTDRYRVIEDSLRQLGARLTTAGFETETGVRGPEGRRGGEEEERPSGRNRQGDDP